jgi:hypothetical protein
MNTPASRRPDENDSGADEASVFRARRTGGFVAMGLMGLALLVMTVLASLKHGWALLVLLPFDVLCFALGVSTVRSGINPCVTFVFPSFLVAFQVSAYAGNANALYFFGPFVGLFAGGLCIRTFAASCILCWQRVQSTD